MKKKYIFIFLVALIALFNASLLKAQGSFSVLVNDHVAHPIDGVYEIKRGDEIKIKIDETGSVKFAIVKSAVAMAAEIPDGQQQQQQQQKLSTADDDGNSIVLPVTYSAGQTLIVLKVPLDSSEQIDMKIVLAFFPQHLQAVRHYRAYANIFKFFIK